MNFLPRRDLRRLKGVFISTGSYPIEWAERVQEFWGAPLYDVYGTTQIGTMFGAQKTDSRSPPRATAGADRGQYGSERSGARSDRALRV